MSPIIKKVQSTKSNHRNDKYTSRLLSGLALMGMITLSFGACKGAVKDGGAVDPFPREMLSHKTFKVFKGGKPEKYLGRVFRDESTQILAEKWWGGGILGDKTGQRREIEYSSTSSFKLKARVPELELNTKYEGSISFKLVVEGLKIYQLDRPVLDPDFRGEAESKENKFIISLLHANSITMQVIDANGAAIVAKADLKDILGKASADWAFDEKNKGVIIQKDAYIGYILAKPRASDLKRK